MERTSIFLRLRSRLYDAKGESGNMHPFANQLIKCESSEVDMESVARD